MPARFHRLCVDITDALHIVGISFETIADDARESVVALDPRILSPFATPSEAISVVLDHVPLQQVLFR